MTNREGTWCWKVVIAAVAATFGCSFFIAHFVWRDVAELTKDAFEPLMLGALPISLDVQHRVLFGLIGLALGLSGGLLAKDLICTRGVAGRLPATLASIRIWFIFLASLAIACSIFYHAAFN